MIVFDTVGGVMGGIVCDMVSTATIPEQSIQHHPTMEFDIPSNMLFGMATWGK